MLFFRPIDLVVDQNVNGQFLGNALSLKYVNQVTYQICIKSSYLSMYNFNKHDYFSFHISFQSILISIEF
jgi:hypothetical protein